MSVDHEHVQELLAGFALHALDPDQLRETEELRAKHLPGCDECRAALASFEATAGELGIAAGRSLRLGSWTVASAASWRTTAGGAGSPTFLWRLRSLWPVGC